MHLIRKIIVLRGVVGGGGVRIKAFKKENLKVIENEIW